jgi:RNA polymerase subunit RPABC4/transcription elongation factor Spt4
VALREKADAGEITETTRTREGPDGVWRAAALVEGLFLEPVGPAAIETLVESGESAFGAEAEPEPLADGVGDHDHLVQRSPLTLRPCADCGKMVSRHARECPECGRAFRVSTFEVPYAGEHPIPVWVFFSLLATAFVLLSPLAVHRLVLTVASRVPEGGELAGQLAVVVAGCYVVSMLCCAGLGSAVGAPRMAYFTGLLLGLFFGPLGVFAAFAIDKRPHCLNCFARVNGLARECPSCHVGLTWVLTKRWY